MLSLTGFFLSKKYRMEKFLFWSRVWMFPVISATFILAMIFSFKWERLEFPIQFSVSLIGYIWCLLILVVFIAQTIISRLAARRRSEASRPIGGRDLGVDK